MKQINTNASIPYRLGWSHGMRKLKPYYDYFTPVGCFEYRQYKQGYIDGRSNLEQDIQNAKRI